MEPLGVEVAVRHRFAADVQDLLAPLDHRAAQVAHHGRRELARGDRQAINYFVAQKYVEAFGKFATAPNQKVIFLPLEATSLLGSLGGIGEIAREAIGRPNGAANGAEHR